MQEPTLNAEFRLGESSADIGVFVCSESRGEERADWYPVGRRDFGGLEALRWIGGGGEEVDVGTQNH